MPTPVTAIHQPPLLRILRRVVLFALLGLMLAAVTWFFTSDLGHQIRHDPHGVRTLSHLVHQRVDDHPLIAPLALVGFYISLTLLLLPVWWLQLLAGYSFGVVFGTLWCMIGAVSGALINVWLSRWLAGDWFQASVESHLARLRQLDEKLGHNGLLVVVVVRLLPLIPFSICNYLLGVTRVSLRDVAVGTSLGTLPHVVATVAFGAYPHLVEDWRFWLGFAIFAVLVSIPVVIRYRKPEWFRRHGLE